MPVPMTVPHIHRHSLLMRVDTAGLRATLLSQAWNCHPGGESSVPGYISSLLFCFLSGRRSQSPDWWVQEEASASALPPAASGCFLPIGSIFLALLPTIWIKVSACFGSPPLKHIKAIFIDDKVNRLLLLLPILFSSVLKSGLERKCLGVVRALSNLNRPIIQLRSMRPSSLGT